MGEDIKKKNLLDDLVDRYINDKLSNENQEDEELKDLLREKILANVTDVIVEKEKDNIVKEAQLEIDKIKDIKKKREMKLIIIETVILAFLIGLLANQGTDLISYTKGSEINIGGTMLWIILLLVINLGFAFFMYLNKLDELFNKK